MSCTFKLVWRPARLRTLAAAAIVMAAVACNAEEASAPIVDTGSTPTETPTSPPMELYTSSTAPGVPYGMYHLPTSLFSSSRYSGSLQALWPSGVYSVLNAARNNGERVVISLAGNRKYYTNSDGTFNLSKWKSRVSAYRSYNLSQYVNSGTVIGHFLVDEPYCYKCWGGRKISASTIEEMARYSKSIWPGMATGVRGHPSALTQQTYRYLDFAWAQWGGPLHYPTYKMTPEQYRDQQTSAARARSLGLVFGLNLLDGGDGSSHINGTYAKDPNLGDNKYCSSSGSCYRYAMSASEVRRVGGVLAAASYGCAMISWKYNTTFLSRSGMTDAMNYVSNVAKNRSRSSCAR